MELLSKVLFICAVSLLNSGCSLIGFTIGKISDSRTPPFTQISYPDTQAVIEQTRAITLALKSGQEISESQINNSCNGALEGFLVGVVVDGAVLVIAIISAQDAYEGFSLDLQL